MIKSFDQYKTIKKIGSGGFSKVYLGIDTSNDKSVAIKCVSLLRKNFDISRMTSVLSLEIEIMQKMNHPNIIEYIDVVKTSNEWAIVLEYCDAGTLEDVIKYNNTLKSDKTRELNTCYYMIQLKNALDYMQKIGYMHRDIKPLNVLITRGKKQPEFVQTENYHYNEKMILKLADFGLVKTVEIGDEILQNTVCGSPLYMSPEIMIEKKYNSKTDLWSFGIIMYQLLFGFNPFEPTIKNKSNPFKPLIDNLMSKNIDFSVNLHYSQECYDIIISMLNKNPNRRIDWEHFLNHKWFKIFENYSETHTDNNNQIVIPKSNPIPITNNIISDNNSDNNSDTNIIINNDNNIGFSNLSRMKINLHHVSPRTYTIKSTKYSPPDILKYPQQRSISVPANKKLTNVINTSHSRFINRYKNKQNDSIYFTISDAIPYYENNQDKQDESTEFSVSDVIDN